MTTLAIIASFFTIVEMNCENLFDCRHDTLKNDVEFTPEGNRQWTFSRYRQKTLNIAQTLMACGPEGTMPDLMALCEVENDTVMERLTRLTPLSGGNYGYVMTNSRDQRGIDVALVYRRLTFKPLDTKCIRVEGDFGDHPPRDILYVKGLAGNSDTLHVMVVHAPSRIGGSETIPRRMAFTRALTHVIDSLNTATPDARIVVTGDFNATSDERSLEEMTGHGMVNIGQGAEGSNGAKGTYKYQGKWETIDHMLVSRSLAALPHSFTIHDLPHLLEPDNRYGGVKPRRTFYGRRYNAEGCSDHLPISLSVQLRGVKMGSYNGKL